MSKTFYENADNYSLSKYVGEELIKNVENWKENIRILRLGNIVGAPGKYFNNKSNLFALDIAKNLIQSKKAVIKNEEDIEINICGIKSLIELIYEPSFKRERYLKFFKIKLTEIAELLRFNYEKLTKKKANIFHNKKLIETKFGIQIPIYLNEEFIDLLKYFLEELRN